MATELVAKSGAAVRAAQALGSAAQAACSLTLAGADGGHACDLRRRLHLPRIFRRSRWGLGSAAAAARGGDRLPHAHPHLPLGGAAALLSSSGAATAAGEELAQALSSAQAAGAEAHVAPALVARVHDAARDVAAYASLPGDAAPGAGAANASVALAAAEELADATVAAVHNAVAAHAPGTATRAAELASLLLPSSEKRDELAAALDVATQAAPKGLGEAGGLLLARLNHTARGGAHRT